MEAYWRWPANVRVRSVAVSVYSVPVDHFDLRKSWQESKPAYPIVMLYDSVWDALVAKRASS